MRSQIPKVLGWLLVAGWLAVSGMPQTALAAGPRDPRPRAAAERSALRALADVVEGTAVVAGVDGVDGDDDRADDLYDRARDLIEQGHFDRAIDALNRLISLNGSRTDAALYWKAYTLERLAPALANDGPNSEYPWPRAEPQHAPVEYRFEMWEDLNTRNGHCLWRLVQQALDHFEQLL